MVSGGDLNLNPEYCFFGVSGTSPEGSNTVVMGDVFLKNFYSLYDQDLNRIGLAIAKHGSGIITENAVSIPDWAIPALLMTDFLLMFIVTMLIVLVMKHFNKRDIAKKISAYKNFKKNTNLSQ